MLVRIFFILAILSPAFILAQENDTINRLDNQGRKTGYWEKKTPDNKLIYQGYFKEGNPVGDMRRFFDTGELKAIMRYEEGNPTVWTKLFYKDGEVAAEGLYLQNQKEGLWTYYSFYSGAVTSTEMYQKGIKHGTEKKFYSNGQVSEEIEWNVNVKHGAWNQYFEDGVRKLVSFHVYGKVSGGYTFYWPNGNLYIKGQFIDNQRHGKWSFYTDEGRLKYEIMYHYGVAENEEAIIKEDQEFFKMVDKNIKSGQFQDPTIEDVMRDSY